MSNTPVISLVLNIHLPFVRHPEKNISLQEGRFFNIITETCLPLLEVFDRLDSSHIPFRMGISISPVLCHMLSDEHLLKRYLEYVDRKIDLGAEQLKEMDEQNPVYKTVKYYYNRFLDQRVLFTERYNMDILKVFDYYQRKGRVELLTTSATHAFLPFYTKYPEVIQAQIEMATTNYRIHFEKYPLGFWLPELGWSVELEKWFRAYNFGYTILGTHALTYANPPAEKGSFFPIKTPSGIFILGRDFYADKELNSIINNPLFRNNNFDLGFELPQAEVKAFLGAYGSRTNTGYKCQAQNSNPYDPEEAGIKVKESAALFLKNTFERLEAAKEYMSSQPVSVCTLDAALMGTTWYEGPLFLEALFRAAHESAGAVSQEILFMTPAEYIFKLDTRNFQVLNPEYSSMGINGYAETWVDSSNDWIYRHTMRALERMIELAERFPDKTGLKERALNQASREILLVLASDWPAMLYRQENSEYAKKQLESCLRNFTTIYEALGSNHISTEWLTNLERRHNIFPNINYRIFRRKK